ncbi:MAG: hypothetical protein KME32_06050 [Mojavia pulchra JT2-VF2]|jgi:hypothetical protein|uniref:Uncharacterized protein n=1 Tax=Mojavia pulchra JT2-VF2 TaxID=287848 RepID=A0A951PX24_9NOST|nr:hypothetical protein [Mojavia pulchra JT2-VF2]
MHNIKHLRLNWLGAGMTLALMSAAIAPASAQFIIINGGSQQPPVGSVIYGSPIPAPIPVNPVTGHKIPTHTNYPYPVHSYPTHTNYPYPVHPYPVHPYPVHTDHYYPRGRRVINRTFIHPNQIHPTVRGSTIIVNPAIVDHSRRGGKFRGRTPGILIYPR